jgi:hypothetical protein
MPLLSPLLMFCSLLLLSAGFALLLYRAEDEDALQEPSPADLSTSRPASRPYGVRVRECLQRCAWRPRARARLRSARAREIMLEMAEVSAARTLLAGCIADLCFSGPASGSGAGRGGRL